jgi:hypothetical protein
MVETLDTGEVEAMAVKLANPSELSNVARTAESILTEAIEFCAQKIGASNCATVVGLLLQNDRTACEYCLYGMAKQVAASLGAIDENVKEVYVFDYDATPEDLCFCTGTHNTRLIHLLVWTQHKTAALGSLVTALDRALAQAYCDTIGTRGLTTLLDVQIVDDVQVEQRHGYGAFWAWVHQTPIRIWQR